MACELCDQPGGELIWQNDLCRVVHIADVNYPGFCRVILNHHVSEMSDLAGPERLRLMAVVFAVEQAVRDILQPDKINLASLGNKTPHVHWHVIPRFKRDRHFPEPIWGMAQRETAVQALDQVTAQRLSAAIQAALD
ncbi:MAG TPA: HIT family protein [Methylophilaceae bacterium]|nr:HIT family protein [Methylophilaceae bacterium]